MKENEEKVTDAEDEWAEFDKEMASGGNFLKLETDKTYKVVIASAELAESDKFKDRQGKPKKQMILTIDKLNGDPCGKKWTTGSWNVMKEVRKAMKDGSLQRSVFLVKKKQDGDKKYYVFEKLDEIPKAEGQPSPSGKDIGAFL